MTPTANTKAYEATLEEARLERDQAWARFFASLKNGTPLALQRAYMHDWLRTDTAVKRLVGWNVLDDLGEV